MSTPKKFPAYLLPVLLYCLKLVRKMNRYWPTEAILQLVHSIIPVPATEVVVVRRRPDGTWEFLLMWRSFEEWPKKYRKSGWYFPGGYMFWLFGLARSCLRHLQKDLRNEYNRTGAVLNFSTLTFKQPVVIGVRKWMPGEHPFGAPVSILCVLELEDGEIPITDRLRWSPAVVVPTRVPHHQLFEEAVVEYLNASPEQKTLIRKLSGMLSD